MKRTSITTRIRLQSIAAALAGLISFTGICQNANAVENESAQIKLAGFDIFEAPLPGTSQSWLKLVCAFTTTAPWTDSISFSYSVIVDPKSTGRHRLRNLTGRITYSNIQQGSSTAVMYLSPNAAQRFGAPIAARIDVYSGHVLIDSIDWAQEGYSYAEATTKRLPAYRGILLSMKSTPWLLEDAEKTPDLVDF